MKKKKIKVLKIFNNRAQFLRIVPFSAKGPYCGVRLLNRIYVREGKITNFEEIIRIIYWGYFKMFIVNVEGDVRKNDKWLIIERSKKEEHASGLLSLVGGKVDKEGNSSDILERTVKGEILEEVGVNVKDRLNYVHSTSFVTDKGENVVDIVFLCEYESGEAFPKIPDEVEEVLWLTTEEVLSHPNSPIYLKESINHAEALIRNHSS